VGLQDETRVLEFIALVTLQRSRTRTKIHREISGVDRHETMQAKVADQLQVARAGTQDHEAARRRFFAQLQGQSGHHAKESAVHARAVLEIERVAGLPLLHHRSEEIVQAAAVLKRRTPLDPHKNRIGICVDQEGRFGDIGHIRRRRKRSKTTQTDVARHPFCAICFSSSASYQFFDTICLKT
jgi:hypothetical protein